MFGGIYQVHACGQYSQLRWASASLFCSPRSWCPDPNALQNCGNTVSGPLLWPSFSSLADGRDPVKQEPNSEDSAKSVGAAISPFLTITKR